MTNFELKNALIKHDHEVRMEKRFLERGRLRSSYTHSLSYDQITTKFVIAGQNPFNRRSTTRSSDREKQSQVTMF
jgi:hypothetical protein